MNVTIFDLKCFQDMCKYIFAVAFLTLLGMGCKEKSNDSNQNNQGNSEVVISEVDSEQIYISEMIDRLEGQYAGKDKGVGYFKIMNLSKAGKGDWKVDIKVKKESDQSVICDFEGTGKFRGKDLIVPLSNVDANLKGSLIIRFVDFLAIVYTEDIDDYKEMATFCNGEGSIAGNFKKMKI